jgi:hypothetical protein
MRRRRMFVRGFAVLVRRLRMGLGLIVLALGVMMGRLVVVMSCRLVRRCRVLMMLVRRMLGLGHRTILWMGTRSNVKLTSRTAVPSRPR